MYRYLFFDADGTLFDFEQAEYQAFALMAQQMGIAAEEEHFLQYKACNASCWKEFERGTLTLDSLKTKRFERFSAETNLPLDPVSASQSYQHHLAAQGILFDHSLPILSTLVSRGYTLFIATNGIADVQWGRFKKSGITHFFQEYSSARSWLSETRYPILFCNAAAFESYRQEKAVPDDRRQLGKRHTRGGGQRHRFTVVQSPQPGATFTAEGNIHGASA